MSKSLLTIDWDYFIRFYSNEIKSYQESEYNIMGEWYKDYLECERVGIDIKTLFGLNEEVEVFWDKLEENVHIEKGEPIILSDSHKVAYEIAKEQECDTVYSIDTHSDLGYDGIQSLNFEVNCANWLGKLFKNNIIKKAYIVHSPYTYEDRAEFDEIIQTYPIQFLSLKEFCNKEKTIDKIHICRSGSWTPPWYDKMFFKFLMQSRREIVGELQKLRVWQPQTLTLANKIECMIGI